jgi:predicted metal-dependent enzyme (double-stranded beta helix superfamily)
MNTENYGIARLVADLRRIRAQCASEHDLIAQVRPLARAAALASDQWLVSAMREPDPDQGFGVFPLHEEPDHTLAVFAFSWKPGGGTPPHDHGTWAVIAGVEGPETNTFWRRVDGGQGPGEARVERIGAKVFGRGDVLAMPTGAIHAVRNEGDRVTVSLHMYGVDPNRTDRLQFDLATHRASLFRTRVYDDI